MWPSGQWQQTVNLPGNALRRFESSRLHHFARPEEWPTPPLQRHSPSRWHELKRGSNSGVESQPSKLLVAGSNPVSRSIPSPPPDRSIRLVNRSRGLTRLLARHPVGPGCARHAGPVERCSTSCSESAPRPPAAVTSTSTPFQNAGTSKIDSTRSSISWNQAWRSVTPSASAARESCHARWRREPSAGRAPAALALARTPALGLAGSDRQSRPPRARVAVRRPEAGRRPRTCAPREGRRRPCRRPSRTERRFRRGRRPAHLELG